MKFTLIAESSSGATIYEATVEADSYKDAHRIFWHGLNDAQRDACASIECVNEGAA